MEREDASNIHLVALCGATMADELWMVTDLLFLTHLIPSPERNRAIFTHENLLAPLDAADRDYILGQDEFDRLRLDVSGLVTRRLSVACIVPAFLNHIRGLTKTMKPNATLVIVLAGHGPVPGEGVLQVGPLERASKAGGNRRDRTGGDSGLGGEN